MIKTLERMGVKRYLYYGVLTAGEVIYHELRRRVDPFLPIWDANVSIWGRNSSGSRMPIWAMFPFRILTKPILFL